MLDFHLKLFKRCQYCTVMQGCSFCSNVHFCTPGRLTSDVHTPGQTILRRYIRLLSMQKYMSTSAWLFQGTHSDKSNNDLCSVLEHTLRHCAFSILLTFISVADQGPEKEDNQYSFEFR